MPNHCIHNKYNPYKCGVKRSQTFFARTAGISPGGTWWQKKEAVICHENPFSTPGRPAREQRAAPANRVAAAYLAPAYGVEQQVAQVLAQIGLYDPFVYLFAQIGLLAGRPGQAAQP